MEVEREEGAWHPTASRRLAAVNKCLGPGCSSDWLDPPVPVGSQASLRYRSELQRTQTLNKGGQLLFVEGMGGRPGFPPEIPSCFALKALCVLRDKGAHR